MKHKKCTGFASGLLRVLSGARKHSVQPAASGAGEANEASEAKIVLCIPGNWTSRAELVERVVCDSDGYIFAGQVLLHMQTRFGCELEFGDADPRMHDAFLATGAHWKNTPEMAAVAAHRSVVYLIGPGGSRHNAEAMIRAGAGIIRAGGLGMKVESSGLAHRPAKWLELAGYLDLYSAHEALVVYVTGAEVYSCGMHSFGLPDAIVTDDGEEDCVELLKAFTHYLFSEQPLLHESETFALLEDEPCYRLHAEAGVDYADNPLFFNPHGNWRLTPAERG
ncbi:MAG: hypothetical protein ABIT83_25875 [Massilia sp.]